MASFKVSRKLSLKRLAGLTVQLRPCRRAAERSIVAFPQRHYSPLPWPGRGPISHTRQQPGHLGSPFLLLDALSGPDVRTAEHVTPVMGA